MKNGFIGRNQGIPVFDDQILPVFGAIAVSSDVLMEEMRVRNDPGILGDGECAVGGHSLITVPDIDFYLDPRINGKDMAGRPFRFVYVVA